MICRSWGQRIHIFPALLLIYQVKIYCCSLFVCFCPGESQQHLFVPAKIYAFNKTRFFIPSYLDKGISDFIINGVRSGLHVVDTIKAESFRRCRRVVWVDNAALAYRWVHEHHDL